MPERLSAVGVVPRVEAVCTQPCKVELVDTVETQTSCLWTQCETEVVGDRHDDLKVVLTGDELSGGKPSSDVLLQAPKSLVSQRLNEWIFELDFDDSEESKIVLDGIAVGFTLTDGDLVPSPFCCKNYASATQANNKAVELQIMEEITEGR
jgi:hypothetical protein